MERVKICELSRGLFSASGFGNRLAPADLLNLTLDLEGRLQLRQGYAVSDLEISHGVGEQLYVSHYLGDRDNAASTRAFLVSRDASVVNAGRRVFFANDERAAYSSHYWVDARTGVGYDWTLPSPGVAPTLTLGFAGSRPANDNTSSVLALPNPFGGHFGAFTDLRFLVLNEGRFALIITDAGKRIVRILHNSLTGGDEPLGAGSHTFRWSGHPQDQDGNVLDTLLARGVYLVYLIGSEVMQPLAIEEFLTGFAIVVGLQFDQIPALFEEEGINFTEDIVWVSFLGEVEDAVVVEVPSLTPAAEDVADNGILVEGDGFRHGWYTVCYSYASSEYGIETAPSPMSQFFVIGSGEDAEDRTPISVDVGFDVSDAPVWADQVKFYGHPGRFAQGMIHPKETPFAFAHLGSRSRELDEDFDTEDYFWENENFEKPRQTMFSKEFRTEPPVTDLEQMVYEVGRIWGYDRYNRAVRFSLIDSRGVENYDVFPYEETLVAHGVTVAGSWQSTVQAIVALQNKGGLYVFFRDAIRLITGESVLSGLYSSEIDPRTDLDASQGINSVGTISGRSAIPFDNFVIFLGSDRTLYQLAELALTDIGKAVQSFINDATDEELVDAFAFEYLDKYHLVLAGDVLVYDTKWKYWTRFDWDLASVFWSRGGVDNESVVYGHSYRDNVHGDVIQLYQGEDDSGTGIEWRIVTAWHKVRTNTKVSAVYLPHTRTDNIEVNVRLEIDIEDRFVEHVAVPHIMDKFRVGVFSGFVMDRFRVVLSGRGAVPDFDVIEAVIHR